MFVKIELVVRQYMICKPTPEKNLCEIINQQVLTNQPILTDWEEIAADIPSKYELYSIELLRKVVNLWINIRGHSFAEGCSLRANIRKAQENS